MTIAEQHRHDLKHQIMLTVWIVVLAYIALNVVAVIIIAASVFASGDFLASVMANSSGSFADNYSSIMSAMSGTSAGPNVIGISSIVSVICTLPIYLILRGKRLFTNDITERRNPVTPMLIVQLLMVAMGAQLVFGVLTSLIDKLLAPLGMSSTSLLDSSMSTLQNPAGLIYVMLIGPICEEIIFRGAILRSLERFGGNFAIVISAVFFGLYHIFTVQAVFAFFMGLILGYTAQRYSILWSMLLHILINSLATAASAMPNAANTAALIALFVLGMICLVLLVRKGLLREQRSLGKPLMLLVPATGPDGQPVHLPLSPHVFRIAFSTISFIVYFIAVIVLGILMMTSFI